MPQVINALARALVYVVLVLATIPTMHTTAAADTATLGTGAAYTGAAWGAGAMQPAPVAHAVCDTDLDCAAYELQQAILRGEVIHEDLSYAGMSELASAKNDLLADAFWAQAPQGMTWDAAKYYLGAWVDCYRSA